MAPYNLLLTALLWHHCAYSTEVEAQPLEKSQVQVHVAGKNL